MASGPDDKAAELDKEWSSLMARAQAGDRAAYERLLRGCTPLIRRVVRFRGVEYHEIDDIVQDVLMTLHRARQTYDPARSFRLGSYGIVGGYAFQPLWGDGHSTGLYTFALLRRLGQAENTPQPA